MHNLVSLYMCACSLLCVSQSVTTSSLSGRQEACLHTKAVTIIMYVYSCFVHVYLFMDCVHMIVT